MRTKPHSRKNKIFCVKINNFFLFQKVNAFAKREHLTLKEHFKQRQFHVTHFSKCCLRQQLLANIGLLMKARLCNFSLTINAKALNNSILESSYQVLLSKEKLELVNGHCKIFELLCLTKSNKFKLLFLFKRSHNFLKIVKKWNFYDKYIFKWWPFWQKRVFEFVLLCYKKCRGSDFTTGYQNKQIYIKHLKVSGRNCKKVIMHSCRLRYQYS